MEYINMDKRFKISKILIRNFIFLLLFATMTTLPRIVKGFGFDSANSCSPNGKIARRGRAQMIAAIPCDLTRQVYCHLPGSAYPWHAVRRFVHENQGLMKRMYGDVRHISVLRDEILNNEIDVDDVEQAAERYTKDGSVNRRASKFMHNREDFAGVVKNNDVLMEPHFRPVSTTSTTTTTTTVAAPVTSTTTIVPTNTGNSKVESTTTRPVQNNGNRGSFLNRRRITTKTTTTTTTNRPETLEEKLNATTTKSSSTLRRTTTNFIGKTKENKKNYVKNAENKEDSNESNETADVMIVVSDDENLASNSVYEIPTSPQADVINGDNIEIIESPQLGLNNIGSSDSSETSTISATLKVITTGSAEAAASPSSSSSVPATQRRPPLTHRQRPTHNYQQQQQQLHKVNSTTILKESSYLKSKLNESERIPSISSSSASASALVKGTTTTAPAATATTTTATHQSNANKKNSNKNNYNNSPTESTAATTSSEHLSSLSAAFASATSSLASVSPLLPLKAASNIELLSGEKLQKQTVTAASSTPPALVAAVAAAASTKPVVLRDGQLFQDTLKQEPTPSANMRGINACPVKEEVVAPFWANNTRGEILALLNLYPFEQYVHWEKCTHELKQMYCRDGCRCEQQYRLHRLLAYDPHNECRGIFSDWFRFPSCCICKCYGMPMEFRATSRSPRSERGDGGIEDIEDSRHPIEIAEEEVKKAIYEHATEEWYRPRDEFDFYEG